MAWTHQANAEKRKQAPVTLPTITLPDVSDEAIEQEAKEVAERIATRRIIRQGADAWLAIRESETFEGWTAIGRALAIGREYALRATGANAPMGRRYSLAFSQWAKEHGFAEMQKSVRSVALELHANIEAITLWRDSLPERQRRRLVHPLSNVRCWRRATTQQPQPRDDIAAALAAWRRFVTCTQSLSAEHVAMIWKAVAAEAAALASA